MSETLEDLVADPRNARKHTPKNIGMLEDALREVGAARSIVVDEANTVLAGNGVVEAAAAAGITRVRFVESDGDEIVAVRRRGLTDEQKRRLALYDNRAAELAEWDPGVLEGMLAEDTEVLEGLFDERELDELLNREKASSASEETVYSQAIQLRPGRDYALIVAENEAEWDRLRACLGLTLQRKGGYKPGSKADTVRLARVVKASAFLERFG